MPSVTDKSPRLVALLAALLLSCGAVAADRAAREYRIAEQPLDQALREFALSTGMDLLFSPDLVAGRTSAGVSGTFRPDEALAELLKGTGLQYSVSGNRVVISRAGSAGVSEAGEHKADPIVLSQVAQTSTERTAQSIAESAPSADQKGIPEILVKGSRVLNSDIPRSRDDIQPYIVLTRETIANSGATDIESFLRQRLTMNTAGASNTQIASTLGPRSEINLRGFGLSQTLILIDGRRAASAMASGLIPVQADLNGIPLGAVERIEILPTTSSGIYGGSATGGVVNVILRRDYAGVEVKATYENTFDTDAPVRKIDIGSGFTFEEGKTNLLIAGSYSDDAGLVNGDRGFISRARNRILANNPNFLLGATSPPLGATSNIRSSNGSPLFGAGTSNFTTVPAGYAGGGGLAPLQLNAGTYTLAPANTSQATGDRAGLLNAPTRESIMGTLRRQFGPRLQAYVELAASNTVGEFQNAIGANTFTVNATAPNNPFGQNVSVTLPLAAATDPSWATTIHDRRAGAGIIAQLPRKWQATLDYTWNKNTNEYSIPSAVSAAATTAIANGVINVLRDTAAFPVDLSAYVNPRTVQSAGRSIVGIASLRLAGPTVQMPGGPAVVSMLLEHQRQKFPDYTVFTGANGNTVYFPDRAQNTLSVYSEVKLPLVSSANRRRGVESLEVQLAGRHDRYEVDGSTSSLVLGSNSPINRATNKETSTNPTLGLSYRPVEDVLLRASYGTGFLPPSVGQVTPGFESQALVQSALVDPRRGNTATAVPLPGVSGGNAGLKPEKSESWSAGVVLTPRMLAGLRLSLDWTRIDKDDIISTLGLQALLDNEALFPGRIRRGATLPGDPAGWAGPVTYMDTTSVNLATAQVEAYDAALDYHMDSLPVGTLDFFAAASWTLHYKTQLLAGQPITENVGVQGGSTIGIPLKFKANGGVTFKHRDWTLGWAMRYFDSYLASTNATTLLNQGNGGRVPSQDYHDVFAGYRFPANRFAGSELRFGVKNVFNTKAPFDAGSSWFYSGIGDVRGASYYLTVGTSF